MFAFCFVIMFAVQIVHPKEDTKIKTITRDGKFIGQNHDDRNIQNSAIRNYKLMIAPNKFKIIKASDVRFLKTGPILTTLKVYKLYQNHQRSLNDEINPIYYRTYSTKIANAYPKIIFEKFKGKINNTESLVTVTGSESHYSNRTINLLLLPPCLNSCQTDKIFGSHSKNNSIPEQLNAANSKTSTVSYEFNSVKLRHKFRSGIVKQNTDFPIKHQNKTIGFFSVVNENIAPTSTFDSNTENTKILQNEKENVSDNSIFQFKKKQTENSLDEFLALNSTWPVTEPSESYINTQETTENSLRVNFSDYVDPYSNSNFQTNFLKTSKSIILSTESDIEDTQTREISYLNPSDNLNKYSRKIVPQEYRTSTEKQFLGTATENTSTSFPPNFKTSLDLMNATKKETWNNSFSNAESTDSSFSPNAIHYSPLNVTLKHTETTVEKYKRTSYDYQPNIKIKKTEKRKVLRNFIPKIINLSSQLQSANGTATLRENSLLWNNNNFNNPLNKTYTNKETTLKKHTTALPHVNDTTDSETIEVLQNITFNDHLKPTNKITEKTENLETGNFIAIPTFFLLKNNVIEAEAFPFENKRVNNQNLQETTENSILNNYTTSSSHFLNYTLYKEVAETYKTKTYLNDNNTTAYLNESEAVFKTKIPLNLKPKSTFDSYNFTSYITTPLTDGEIFEEKNSTTNDLQTKTCTTISPDLEHNERINKTTRSTTVLIKLENEANERKQRSSITENSINMNLLQEMSNPPNMISSTEPLMKLMNKERTTTHIPTAPEFYLSPTITDVPETKNLVNTHGSGTSKQQTTESVSFPIEKISTNPNVYNTITTEEKIAIANVIGVSIRPVPTQTTPTTLSDGLFENYKTTSNYHYDGLIPGTDFSKSDLSNNLQTTTSSFTKSYNFFTQPELKATVDNQSITVAEYTKQPQN